MLMEGFDKIIKEKGIRIKYKVKTSLDDTEWF